MLAISWVLVVLCHYNVSKASQKLQLLQKSAQASHRPSKHQIKGDQIIDFISSTTNQTRLVGERKKTLAWFVSCHPGTIRISWLHFWITVTTPEQNVLTFWCIFFHILTRYFRLLWISEEHSHDTIIPKSHRRYFLTRCSNLVQLSPNSADWRTACKIIKYSPSLNPNGSPP